MPFPEPVPCECSHDIGQLKLISVDLSELSIEALQPDLKVGARARKGTIGAGVIKEWFTSQQDGISKGSQFLQPNLDHIRVWRGQVERFPRPVTKIKG